MLNSMKYSVPVEVQTAVSDQLAKTDLASRIWQKDASVWTDGDEAEWLGWLDIVAEESSKANEYKAFYDDIVAAGFTDVLLMGMGGSSLCPEVLAMTFGKKNFHILDSTDPAQIKTIENKLDLEKTLFIVASKSGATLEPNCFKQYFFERVAEKVGRENAGKQFVAITDPGSKMEQVAKDDGFRRIFYGKPEIGGRFSALSAFGMTAAAAMGIDVAKFLAASAEMVDACKNDSPLENPGGLLGTILGSCHSKGRDKLTIFASSEVSDLGAWLEQLIAESTGKKGVAIIPVDREPVQPAAEYSNDRVFAILSVKGNNDLDVMYDDLIAAGHPVVRIELDNIDNLGQEFFRWEFATAVAGSIMQINPFDQPDVEAAKIEARKITEKYEQDGKLPDEKPFFEDDKFQFFASDDAAKDYADKTSSADIVTSFIDSNVGPGDYFATLAYVEMSAENEAVLQALRESVLSKKHVATCLGFGPRFLHSTGQAYKGGANNGVFLQITCDDASDLPVPGQKYTFGVVKAAQSRGDFQVLVDRGRRSVRIHLKSSVEDLRILI